MSKRLTTKELREIISEKEQQIEESRNENTLLKSHNELLTINKTDLQKENFKLKTKVSALEADKAALELELTEEKKFAESLQDETHKLSASLYELHKLWFVKLYLKLF